jgi:hypothetical protein
MRAGRLEEARSNLKKPAEMNRLLIKLSNGEILRE